jgi:hypothetical protein
VQLTATTSRPQHNGHRGALGFWMNSGDEGARVRVFVPYPVLGELDPSAPLSMYSALEIFDCYRKRIEEAANNRFKRDGSDEGDRHEDRPSVVVASSDFR